MKLAKAITYLSKVFLFDFSSYSVIYLLAHTKILIFQIIVDPAKTKMSELAQQYENEVDSGINIEMAKQVLREEDQFDKQRFREKIKERHREEKRKSKIAKKAETNDEEGEDAGGDYDSESEASEGPDLSWLPDPDKIYGKQQDGDEEISSANESGENEESEEESIVHR